MACTRRVTKPYKITTTKSMHVGIHITYSRSMQADTYICMYVYLITQNREIRTLNPDLCKYIHLFACSIFMYGNKGGLNQWGRHWMISALIILFATCCTESHFHPDILCQKTRFFFTHHMHLKRNRNKVRLHWLC